MDEKYIQECILQLAFEMTASTGFANYCIDAMDCEEEDLFYIEQYLKKLITEKQQSV